MQTTRTNYTIRATRCGLPAIKVELIASRFGDRVEFDFAVDGHVKVENLKVSEIPELCNLLLPRSRKQVARKLAAFVPTACKVLRS